MPILADNELCRISFERGADAGAVISFTGIGHGLGAIPQEEFRKSLAARGTSTYFVTDKRRHWYNGCFDLVLDILERHLAREGISEVVTLGNSMGGFGAIVFAEAIGACSRSIAFCPQSSMHRPTVPFESRWTEYSATIEAWTLPDAVGLLTGEVEHFLIYGRHDAKDMLHAGRFAASGRAAVFCVDGGHDAAASLKRQGKLVPVIEAVLSGGSAAELSSLLGVAAGGTG
jgi:hypothetical protein